MHMEKLSTRLILVSIKLKIVASFIAIISLTAFAGRMFASVFTSERLIKMLEFLILAAVVNYLWRNCSTPHVSFLGPILGWTLVRLTMMMPRR